MAAGDVDPRDMASGALIHTWVYSDQPYCVVVTQPHLLPPGARSLFVCMVTVNDAHEGSSGEHVVSVSSEDQVKNSTLFCAPQLDCSVGLRVRASARLRSACRLDKSPCHRKQQILVIRSGTAQALLPVYKK